MATNHYSLLAAAKAPFARAMTVVKGLGLMGSGAKKLNAHQLRKVEQAERAKLDAERSAFLEGVSARRMKEIDRRRARRMRQVNLLCDQLEVSTSVTYCLLRHFTIISQSGSHCSF